MSSAPHAAEMPARARWSAFVICLGAGFMALLDVSIVNVALPSIERALEPSPSQLQWVVAGYGLTFGLVLVPAGRLGDVLSRRWVFVLGLSGFVLAAAACGFAPTPEVLVGLRLLQGVFAGVLNPQVIGLIQELFRGPERGRAFGYFGATIGISTALGPLVGGLLIAAFGPEEGWRAVFLVNVPLGLILVPLALRYLPRTAPQATQARIDVVGMLLIAAAVLCIMFPFASASDAEANDVPWWLLGVATVLIAAFVLWERRLERAGGSPVVSSELMRTPSFVLGAAVAAAYFAGFTGMFLAGTLYLQQGLGLSALQAGLTLTSFALMGAISAALSGRLVQRFGRWTVVTGIALTGIGMAGVASTAATTDGPQTALVLACWLAIAGLGNGAVISPNQALTLADVPVTRGGSAGGVLQTGQRMGAAIGIAIAAAVFFSRLEQAGSGALAGGYGPAMRATMVVALTAMSVAFLLALTDALRRRTHH
ncbi:MFS transporter [Bogoriella caseilytica]|uniref:EmrB/QacA subfamily drug resistance transporter n=1 Tax=Bogoriella caseilytica TaxID=56055 RepID=A0A3N2BBC2_9MICO|nr:MFS transporter [Bogoriella caseilytica]ROR72545.1 EmrB/QacA subfamily drug resistance transporter [Bogoriella caseilytica]